ncbi:MAG: hypothetical protein KME13_22195 [Myxacorys californica WJT36-NPBG1]|nr:hypothetical protein [Myxacorys californica WJT36-NPBG1]
MFTYVLTELVRQGAQQIIAHAVEAEFLVVSQVRRAKLGFVYQVQVLILEALAKHQVPSVA